jgi:hypothetical protein
VKIVKSFKPALNSPFIHTSLFCDIELPSSLLTTPLLNLCKYHSGSCDHTGCCGSLSQQCVLSTVRTQILSPKLSSGQTIFCALRACIFSMLHQTLYRPNLTKYRKYPLVRPLSDTASSDVHRHQKVLGFQVFRRNPSFLDFRCLELFPYHSANAMNASIVPEETLGVRSFLGSADPNFL